LVGRGVCSQTLGGASAFMWPAGLSRTHVSDFLKRIGADLDVDAAHINLAYAPFQLPR
jgi:hypothetical protein